MWHYIIFFSHKPAKVTSDFILNYLKKVIGGATTQKNLKTNTKTLISFIWIRPQGSQGCQKMRQGPLNMPFEVWCANIAPKLKNIRNTLRKQAFFDIFFQFLQFFEVCAFLGQYLRKNSTVLFVEYFCEFFDTPGTPGSASI